MTRNKDNRELFSIAKKKRCLFCIRHRFNLLLILLSSLALFLLIYHYSILGIFTIATTLFLAFITAKTELDDCL